MSNEIRNEREGNSTCKFFYLFVAEYELKCIKILSERRATARPGLYYFFSQMQRDFQSNSETNLYCTFYEMIQINRTLKKPISLILRWSGERRTFHRKPKPYFSCTIRSLPFVEKVRSLYILINHQDVLDPL